MKHHDKGVTAQWECRLLELPDADITRDTFVLAPSYLFGEKFNAISSDGDATPVQVGYPRRKLITATVSKPLYTIMLRVQQGSEASGDEPPLWALVEGTAKDNESGRVLDTGEVFPLI